MDPTPTGDNSAFRQWTDLTDAYAREFHRLQAGDQAALSELRRLSGELQRFDKAMGRSPASLPPSGDRQK